MVSIRLVKDSTLETEITIKKPIDAVRLIRDLIKDMDREFLCMVNLKKDGTPINCNIISVGSLDASIINARELMKVSILSNSAGIMLLHNHPSGSLIPSKEDIRVTNKIQLACELMDIRLVDHLIVGGENGRVYSMREQEELRPSQLMYATSIENLYFEDLLIDEVELQEPKLTNIIDNYFRTPTDGYSYGERLTNGYLFMQAVVSEMEEVAGMEPALSQRLAEVAKQEGIRTERSEERKIVRFAGRKR